MATKIGSKYTKTRGKLKNYPPQGQGGRRAPELGNSVIFHVFFLYFDPILVPILKII